MSAGLKTIFALFFSFALAGVVSAQTYCIRADTVIRLRSRPGTEYSIVERVPSGTRMTVIGHFNRWKKISRNGQEVWMADWVHHTRVPCSSSSSRSSSSRSSGTRTRSNLGGTANISYGSTSTGYLDDGNYFDDYKFYARSGDVIRIDMTDDGDLDPKLSLWDGNGRRYAYDYDGGSDSDDARINNFRITRSGDYFIHAERERAGRAGHYELTLRLLSSSGSSSSSSSSARWSCRGVGSCRFTGRISSSNVSDEYVIYSDGPAAEISISMRETSGNLDTLLRIYDRWGDLVETDDDGGSGTNSFIRLTTGAPYRFEVHATRFRGSQGSSSGSYELEIDIRRW